MKYCIFGGSFDPPHAGHRYLARSAFDALHLDKLLWVPAPDPPHKAKPSTPFQHRLAMVRLAIADLPGHEASDIETRLPSPSYTLNTIEALKAEYGGKHAWYLLIGADNWAIFPTWHRHEDVLKAVSVVVFPRKESPIGELPAGVQALPLPELDVESRGIRGRLGSEADFDAAGVLPQIRNYIRAEGLYGMRKIGDAA